MEKKLTREDFDKMVDECRDKSLHFNKIIAVFHNMTHIKEVGILNYLPNSGIRRVQADYLYDFTHKKYNSFYVDFYNNDYDKNVVLNFKLKVFGDLQFGLKKVKEIINSESFTKTIVNTWSAQMNIVKQGDMYQWRCIEFSQ